MNEAELNTLREKLEADALSKAFPNAATNKSQEASALRKREQDKAARFEERQEQFRRELEQTRPFVLVSLISNPASPAWTRQLAYEVLMELPSRRPLDHEVSAALRHPAVIEFTRIAAAEKEQAIARPSTPALAQATNRLPGRHNNTDEDQ